MLVAAASLVMCLPSAAQRRAVEQPAGTLDYFRQFGAPSAEFAVLLAIVEVEYLRKRGTDLNRALATNPDTVVIATAHALSEQVRHAGSDPARRRILQSLELQFTHWLAAVDRLRQSRGLPPWNGQRMAKLAVEAHRGLHDGSVAKTFGVTRGRSADMFASMARSGLAGLLTPESQGSIRLLDERASRVAPPPAGIGPSTPAQTPPGCPAAHVVGIWWLKSRYEDRNLKRPIMQYQVEQAGDCSFVLRNVSGIRTSFTPDYLEFRYAGRWTGGKFVGPLFFVTGPRDSRGRVSQGGKEIAAIRGTDGRRSICPFEVNSCLYRDRPR